MFKPMKSPAGRFALAGTALLLTAGLQSAASGAQYEAAVAQRQSHSYSRDVRPILDQKCIACHACYDAPCQLKLTSAEGLLRGATTRPVYDSTRIRDADPTRLLIDAAGEASWRQKGFFAVLNDRGGSAEDNLANSLLYRMITLGRTHPLAANTPVPEDIELGLSRKNQCPRLDEFDDYATKNPQQGMPLAMAGLSEREYQTLRQWIIEGAVIDETPRAEIPAEARQVAQWEDYLNRAPLPQRLVARYLYEHLHPAHLYFEELDTGNFFELVRSSTPPGKPIRVIATARPNDDPGGPLYFRLRRLTATVVHKTHMPYPLGVTQMARLEKLFFADDWDVAQLPDYSRASAINPVATFNAIPAAARYRFLLDSAFYLVSTFIRGPVCAGQIATNVIEDRFFVLFQDPAADLAVTDPDYLASILPHLVLVPQQEGLIRASAQWKSRVDSMNRYHHLRGEAYKRAQPEGRSLDDIWYGGDGAALTVFRNFDNAMVSRGFIGATPETAWVMDFPMLERTFYLLVVNFNVFGSVASQAETRLYFDLMRANGENNFLHFMPAAARTAMRESWYRGSDAETKMSKTYEIVNERMPVQISYRTGDPKAEFVAMAAARMPGLAGQPDLINRCTRTPCYAGGATPAQKRIEASLQTLASRPATADGMGFVHFMPDVAFLRVSTPGVGAGHAYTLIRNKAHTNVAFMFDESDRRERAKDTLTLYRGLLGSYPNFMFHVPLERIEEFADALHVANKRDQFVALVNEFGLLRTNPGIWENFQWFIDYMRATEPLQAGVYDLSRYKKVAEMMDDAQG